MPETREGASLGAYRLLNPQPTTLKENITMATTLKEIRETVRSADEAADERALRADEALGERALALEAVELASSDEARAAATAMAAGALCDARAFATESITVRSSVDRERSALAAVSASRRVVRQRLAERMRTVRALFSE